MTEQKKYTAALASVMMLAAAGCSTNAAAEEESSTAAVASTETKTTSAVTSKGIATSDFFTDRDLNQSPDLADAKTYNVSDGENITITEEGIYVLSGTASNVTVTVEAADDAKVQIVLDGVSITNDSAPAIYVKSADKVFVTTTSSENSLSVTGTFTADGETNTDGVIFSKSDLVFNGTGTLNITSTDHAVVSKDGIKVTGGTYNITSEGNGFMAHDYIAVADGTFNVNAGNDAFKAKDDEDDTVGYIVVEDGTFNVTAGEDGFTCTTINQIDGGSFEIEAVEGIEGTYVIINDGTISISASDDGINASQKSSQYDVLIEFNGGDTTIVMGQGDTDGVDANGSIIVNGGTINVTGNSAFDYDQTATLNGGTVIINGEEVDEIPESMMGGGMPGGMQGGQNGGGRGQGTGGPQNGAPQGNGTVSNDTQNSAAEGTQASTQNGI